jgi:hypothetical protein
MGDHYIPRLLLRRFKACETRSGTPLVYQFQRNLPLPSRPFAIDRIASEKLFYENSKGLDIDAIGMHQHEMRAGRALSSFENGTSDHFDDAAIASVFSVAMARTKNFRTIVCEMLQRLVHGAKSTIEDGRWDRMLKDTARNNLQDLFDSAAENLDPEERASASTLLATEAGRAFVADYIEKQDVSEDSANFIAALTKFVDSESWIRDVQVDALVKVLRREIMPWLSQVRFERLVIAQDDEPLILGDVCVVAVSREGAFGHPMQFGSESRVRLLPIGPRMAIAAVEKGATLPSISSDAINRCSAALSRSFFFSSQNGNLEAQLHATIGSAVGPVSEIDIQEIIAEAFRHPSP